MQLVVCLDWDPRFPLHEKTLNYLVFDAIRGITGLTVRKNLRSSYHVGSFTGAL